MLESEKSIRLPPIIMVFRVENDPILKEKKLGVPPISSFYDSGRSMKIIQLPNKFTSNQPCNVMSCDVSYLQKCSHILLLQIFSIQSRFRDLEGSHARSVLHLATPQTLESLNQACKT